MFGQYHYPSKKPFSEKGDAGALKLINFVVVDIMMYFNTRKKFYLIIFSS